MARCENVSDIPALLFGSPANDAPKVLSSSPLPGQNSVTVDTVIFVEFDREMDRRSVEDSFSLVGSSPVSGDFEWIGNRLYFRLDKPLAPGASYELTVGQNASDINGSIMGIPYYVSFYAGSRIDAPFVQAMNPAPNAQNVAPDVAIEITFSRPMMRESINTAFRISPAVPGLYEWSENDSRLRYIPIQPLASGQSYSITITTDALDLEGIPIANQFSATFQAGNDFVPPEVESVFESGNPVQLTDGATGISKDSSFRIHFNEPMNYLTTTNAASLRDRNSNTVINADYSWSADFSQLTIIPAQPLNPENEYRVQIGTGASDAAGNFLQNLFNIDFQVNGTTGALNSNFLRINSINKVFPGPMTGIDTNPDIINQINLPNPRPAGGWNATIEIEFSHDVASGTLLPENITIAKLTGSESSAVYIESILMDSSTGFTSNILRLRLSGLYQNIYRLRFYGDRNGIKSLDMPGESPTWMQENTILYFQVTGN